MSSGCAGKADGEAARYFPAEGVCGHGLHSSMAYGLTDCFNRGVMPISGKERRNSVGQVVSEQGILQTWWFMRWMCMLTTDTLHGI